MRVAYDYIFHLEYDKEKYKEMLLDAAETVLGIFGFDRTLFGKSKDKKWVDGIKEKCNARDGSGSRSEMMESQELRPASEIVAYHKIKRRFLSLKDREKENPEELQICEFTGQNFELIAD